MTSQENRAGEADEEGGRALLTRRRLCVVKCASGVKPEHGTRQSKIQKARALYGLAIDRVGLDRATDDRGAV
jgi:hypothetical protein